MRFCFSIVKTNASFTLWHKRTLIYPKFAMYELKFCPKVSIKESFYTCVENNSKLTSNLTTICDTFFQSKFKRIFHFNCETQRIFPTFPLILLQERVYYGTNGWLNISHLILKSQNNNSCFSIQLISLITV